MGSQGTTLLDFGAFPGASEASVFVADGGIVAASLAEAWLFPADTVDHLADEHRVEQIKVTAAGVVNASGFTVYGRYDGVGDTMPYGKWNVAWVWN